MQARKPLASLLEKGKEKKEELYAADKSARACATTMTLSRTLRRANVPFLKHLPWRRKLSLCQLLLKSSGVCSFPPQKSRDLHRCIHLSASKPERMTAVVSLSRDL